MYFYIIHALKLVACFQHDLGHNYKTYGKQLFRCPIKCSSEVNNTKQWLVRLLFCHLGELQCFKVVVTSFHFPVPPSSSLSFCSIPLLTYIFVKVASILLYSILPSMFFFKDVIKIYIEYQFVKKSVISCRLTQN